MRRFYRYGSIPIRGSVEGNGHPIASEDYCCQGLDTQTSPYDYYWLDRARTAACLWRICPDSRDIFNPRAGDWKYRGQVTPLGTPVAQLVRQGHDMLASPCGYCGWVISACKCGSGTDRGPGLDGF